MKHKLLDCVVLVKDLPEFGLRAGDLGTIVATYEPDGLEVEFVKIIRGNSGSANAYRSRC